MNKILQQLNLTAEQSQKIVLINQEFRTKNAALDEKIYTNGLVMGSPLVSEASPEELRHQHRMIQALQQQLSDNRFEMMLQVKEVLNHKQQVHLAELMEQRNNQRQ